MTRLFNDLFVTTLIRQEMVARNKGAIALKAKAGPMSFSVTISTIPPINKPIVAARQIHPKIQKKITHVLGQNSSVFGSETFIYCIY